MTTVHALRAAERKVLPPVLKGGELVPLPFVELETVIESVKMLRRFPREDILDNFNRMARSKSSDQ